ncbi:nitroreductase family protein [Amycolatopsis sp. FDAARGOS 1241]|uniref:nitroreductase family protein n=1 Tax=Amycolatopsis sp. FDAARGOS 1241 TaxID=2778070 RepID=UPI001950D244|nr:nitroreductase family protein [Amycolatopsis sp. FDAARGOS 1241]QRP47770.1 nitroreductase family protein [Amycolatopsis sp. FDAARGOS 1241]
MPDMDVHEALYTTRMMRRMHADPIPLEVQARILDAAIRAPNGGNTQRWHFLAVDDPDTKAEIAPIYRRCRDKEYEEINAGTFAVPLRDVEGHAETMQRITKSSDFLVEHFTEIPLLLFVFSIDDHGGANIYPAIWSTLLAARAEGVGGVLTTMLRMESDRVMKLLEVPEGEGWELTAMLALGYPRGKWGVAANRRPVHEVSSRNRWGRDFGVSVPEPLWPAGQQG